MKTIFLSILFFTNTILGFEALAATAKIDKIWNKVNIKVCFAHKDHKSTAIEFNDNGTLTQIAPKTFGNWNNELKTLVKSWVNSEYSLEKTVINFIGWNDCSDKISKEDIAIYISSDNSQNVQKTMRQYGMASIGRNGHLEHETTKKAYAYFLNPKIIASDYKNLSTDDIMQIFKQNIIHEFGHLAGLMHEHDREEIIEDHSCKSVVSEDLFEHFKNSTVYSYFIAPNEVVNFIKQDYMPGVKITKYDSYSIMNYCMVERLRKNPKKTHNGLSPLDRKALQEMYDTK